MLLYFHSVQNILQFTLLFCLWPIVYMCVCVYVLHNFQIFGIFHIICLLVTSTSLYPFWWETILCIILILLYLFILLYQRWPNWIFHVYLGKMYCLLVVFSGVVYCQLSQVSGQVFYLHWFSLYLYYKLLRNECSGSSYNCGFG